MDVVGRNIEDRLAHGTIDDRTDVLEAMIGVVPNSYLLGPQAARPRGMIHVPSWKEVALQWVD